jgi:hypothetical protein
MKLWHVSGEAGISLFEPRIPPSFDAGVTHPVVWAVADSHLVNYLFPRECPRVAIRRSENTSDADANRFFGPGSAEVILFIEAPWFELATQPVWLYELPPTTFECADTNAGYFVSSKPVVPALSRQVQSPLAELLSRKAELRVVQRLRPVAEAVAASSLSFSIIRLRNAFE